MLAPSFCEAYDMGIIPFFPLASGFLTGKYRRGEPIPEGTRMYASERWRSRNLTDRNFDVLERLEPFAAERGHPMVDLALAWLLYNPLVSSVIAGASNPEQLAANAKAADWHLTAEEMEELDGILSDGAA